MERSRYLSSPTVFFILSLLAFATEAQAQPQVEARVLNPVAFLEPGASDELLIELTNPTGSGITVTGVSGGGYSGGYIGYTPGFAPGEPIFWSIDNPPKFVPITQRPLGCESFACLESGEFPLRPGESLVLRAWRITMGDMAPEDTLIFFTMMRLSLSGLPGQEPSQYLYLDKNVVRIAGSPGGEYPAKFADLTIDSEQAGFPSTDVQGQLHYPTILRAGDHFNVSATLKNNGEHRLTQLRLMSLSAQHGEHGDSYDYRNCRTDCQLTGPAVFNSGVERMLDLGNFYYKNELLKPGVLKLYPPVFYALDHLGRQVTFNIDATAIEIMVTTEDSGVSPNPATAEIPQRQPLRNADFATTGDALLLHDPNTGNDWMHLSQSKSMSLHEVQQETSPGGRFAGFSIASSMQVETLLLNHLHATGISAFGYMLHTPRESAVNQALLDFMAMIDEVETSISSPVLQAVVSDLPAQSENFSEQISVLYLRPNRPAGFLFVEPSGLYRETYTAAQYYLFSTWLVRSASEKPERPLTQTSFFERTLHIPSVAVDGKRYTVNLEMLDAVSYRLKLISLQSLPDDAITSETVVFSNATGRVRIPRASLLLTSEETQYYEIELEFLPNSNPAVFDVIDLRPISPPTSGN